MGRFIAVAALAACGCSSNGGREAAELGQVATEIVADVRAHHSAIASATTAAECETERIRYGDQVSPLLDRMQAISVDVDSCMMDMGHATTMRSLCSSMRDEYERHMTAACASSNMVDNEAEAATHAQRMIDWSTVMTESSGMTSCGMMR